MLPDGGFDPCTCEWQLMQPPASRNPDAPALPPGRPAGVRATDAALALPAGSAPWTLLLVVFTLWSLIASALLFPLAVER